MKIEAGSGNDYIYTSCWDATISGGRGNDTLEDQGEGTEVILFGKGDGSDVILDYRSQNLISLTSGKIAGTLVDGSDMIISLGKDSLTLKDAAETYIRIKDADGKNIIINEERLGQTISNYRNDQTLTGGLGEDTIYNRGSNVSIIGDAGNDSIYSTGDTVTIDAGAGNDTIDNSGSNVTIDAGAGDNFIHSSDYREWNAEIKKWETITPDNVFVKVDGGNNTVKGANITIQSGKGNTTLTGDSNAQLYRYGGGNDVITNYSGEDTIELASGNADSYSFDDGDLIFHVGDGSLTLMNMKNHAITVKDSSGATITKIYGTGYSGHEVIKNFVQSTARSVLDSKLKLDEAIRLCSQFNSLQEVIDAMVADCREAGDADVFLRKYCGIILDNADMGAVTGWDAGGLVMKNADSLYTAAGDAVYPESTTFTIRGLTITVPEKDTLSEKEELIVKGFYSWWAEDAIKLIEESYGVHFDGQKITLTFISPGGFGAAYGSTDGISIVAGNNLSEDNLRYVHSGTIAHEMTHVMQGILELMSHSTPYMTEGMANLTGGSNDYTLADNPDKLEYYLDLNKNISYLTNPGDYVYMYPVGYMFWRYLMKQASDSYDSLASYAWKDDSSIAGTDADDFLTGSGSNQTLSAGAGNDTITAYGDSAQVQGDDGDDYILTNGNGIAASGGLGNDILKNSGDNSTLTGGADNDLLVNGGYWTSERGGSNVVLNGGAGNDTLSSHGSKSLLDGGNNDDLICNGYRYYESGNYFYQSYSEDYDGNHSTVLGGAGNDTINNLGANVYISGGSGNDSILLLGNSDATTVDSDEDDDYIENEAANVSINGGDGADVIKNRGKVVTIDTGDGNDSVDNYNSSVSMDGGAGDDDIYNSSRSTNVSILGGDGEDTIHNWGASALIDGGDGFDTISGFNETSTLSIAGGAYSTTRNGSDVVVSVNAGKITLRGAASLSGLNIIAVKNLTNQDNAKVTLPTAYASANAANRSKKITVVGNALDNTIVGGSGNDQLLGGDGNDSIVGSKGADKLWGSAGEDTLCGGTGNDTLNGGAGKDLFVFSAGNDIISDYSFEDKISIPFITKTAIRGSDVVLTCKTGSLTVKNAKNKPLTLIDTDGTEFSTIISGSLTLSDKSSSKVTLPGTFAHAKADSRSKPITIIGNKLDNSILGGKSNDQLTGGSGNDTLNGNSGNDMLFGGSGDDFLVGGAGNDSLWGNSGFDTFVYNPNNGKDVIFGFDSDDLLQINGEWSASYLKVAKKLVFKVDTGSVTMKDFSASNFNVNGDTYIISGNKFLKK